MFVYKVDSVELYKKDNFKTLDKDNVINKWYNIQNISNMDIRPEFIKNCYNDDNLKNEIINENSYNFLKTWIFHLYKKYQ